MYVDPVNYLPVVLSIAIGIAPVLYFRRNGMLFLLAALAYFMAIVAKLIVQALFYSFFHEQQLATYIAYGALTAVFEIGFAYAFALLYKGKFSAHRGWAYGSYLAFFENAIVVGAFGLLSLIVINLFVTRGTGLDSLASGNILMSIPSAFERITSLIAHAVWGYLALFAAVRRKPAYVLAAVPLAFIDSAAAWWDMTHAISYPLLIAVLFTFVVVWSAAALAVTGQLGDARRGLGRKAEA